MRAYVFLSVAPGKAAEVVEQVRAIEGVMAADVCWGLPDIVTLVEVADFDALQDFVLRKIQAIAGVNQTDTHIAWNI